jgi:hypothetical protein
MNPSFFHHARNHQAGSYPITPFMGYDPPKGKDEILGDMHYLGILE